jgi:hypothetical protein
MRIRKERTMSEIPTPTPDPWQPLHTLIGDAIHCADFMFMGTFLQGAAEIFLYKHGATRHYLNIDVAGQCYRYGTSGQRRGTAYQPIATAEALARVMEEK